MIKLLVIGHLGKDATLGNAGGKNVLNFSVAHTEKYKDAQGVQQSKTTWVECAYWTDKLAIQPYLTKGTQVYVEGVAEVGQYTNNQQAVVSTLKCRVFSVQLLSAGTATAAPAAAAQTAPPPPPVWNGTAWVTQQPAAAPAAQQNAPVDDDLPF